MHIPFSRFALLVVLILLTGGCNSVSSVYYQALEKVGIPKRDALVTRVEKARDAQTDAKTEFADALEKFLAVTAISGGELQAKYSELNSAYKRSEQRAKQLNERIDDVENVAESLFREWKLELEQYTSATLKNESQRQLDATRRSYDQALTLMRRAASRMDPILATFRDQVLFLKHNLNARALAALDATNNELQADITRLIADMEASIRESEAFLGKLRSP